MRTLGQKFSQFVLTSFERVHLALHTGMEHAFLDRLDHSSDLLVDLGLFRSPNLGIRPPLAVEAIDLSGISAHRFCSDFRRHHTIFKTGEDACFQILTRDRAAV
ncbi:hypothetical protein [Ochrobactrum sp. 19YEA23]|uniref:hypothetical protein n=1 Tax=Ochrobactrum sp. 19YEA23 TaxID=3039854 RepID=UPI003709AA1E